MAYLNPNSTAELTDSDKTTGRSNLEQLIDIVSGDISGSDTRRKYEVFVTGGNNIASVTSSLFQTVYDQDFSLQTSNAIMDMTVGLFSGSTTVAGSSTGQDTSGKLLFPSQSLMMREKVSIYKQYAQTLLGDPEAYFTSPFDTLATDSNIANKRIDEAVFVNFKRLFVRDGIKEETLALKLAATGTTEANKTNIHSSSLASADNIILTDLASTTNKRLSYCGKVGDIVDSNANSNFKGVVFYDKGIAVLDAKRCFKSDQAISGAIDSVNNGAEAEFSSGKSVISASLIPNLFVSASIDDIVEHVGFTRFGNSDLTTAITYRNKTAINSTLYFCRAAPGFFNYSTNPTYTDSDGKIRVVDSEDDLPFSYVTTIGLYNDAGELLAVAKTSRPIEKNPETDLTIRVRLDY
tara:strand:- start:573 stop:1793 length:1221 start_codon:yes stop_codon:yes gene_type:complete